MNTNNVIDAALAFAVKSYGKPATATIKEDRPIKAAPLVPKVSDRVTTPRAPKAEKAAKVETTEPIATLPLPMKGTLTAKQFVLTTRNAKSRDEKILAIAAFVGYDVKGDFGSQEMSAMMAAKRELYPIDGSGPTRQEARAAQRSAMGFIQGMPDNHKVRLNDLLGREKMAADTMIEQEKLAAIAFSEELRTHHMALAALEQERLTAIRSEIRSMVG